MDAAWLDNIKDSLPAKHSHNDVAIAVTKQLCVDFANYKSIKGLESCWHKRKDEIERLKNHDKNLHNTLIDAYENRMIELEERKVA